MSPLVMLTQFPASPQDALDGEQGSGAPSRVVFCQPQYLWDVLDREESCGVPLSGSLFFSTVIMP